MMHDLLIKLGIPTYSTTIYTPITADVKIQIAKQLPTTVGMIFGLSIYCDTVTPDNKALITTSDAQNLYVSLVDGTNQFYQEVRLDDMLMEFAGVPAPKPQNYLPVMIPNTIDLSTSFYLNPTGIGPGANTKTIALKLWYVTTPVYKHMVETGMVMVNAKK